MRDRCRADAALPPADTLGVYPDVPLGSPNIQMSPQNHQSSVLSIRDRTRARGVEPLDRTCRLGLGPTSRRLRARIAAT